MMILQRYFAVSIGKAVLFVLMAFLALVAFLDLTYVLPQVGKNDFGIQHAFMYVLLLVPGNVNTVLPVAALIGTIYTMAQFASSSEFTIMRASSMSTRRAALMLAKVGICIVAIAFLFGELITPQTAPIAERLRLTAKGGSVSGEFRSGMWTKDNVHEQGVRGKIIGSRFFNVRRIAADGQLEDVRLYEFDNNMRIRSIVTAEHGVYDGNNLWRLTGVTETRFANSRELPAPGSAVPQGQRIQETYGHETASVSTRKLDSYELPSEITPRILSVSRSDPERMSAVELAVYTRHLAENRQETDRFKVAFWKKIFDPLSIMVLMALALPFAYLHTRSGGVSLKIFIGIMIGVSFLLINSLFSHLGVLTILPPLVTAVAPSALFLLLAVGALWWVERH